MKLAVLYICTGRYDIFWKDFYDSCEQFLIPDAQKEYFVFTDADALYEEEKNSRIHKIFQERLGWPNDTLLRFQLFLRVEEQLKNFDYIFFFNANARLLSTITASELLPTKEEELVAVLHPGYYNVKPSKFTYESRQKKSLAYIPKGKGKHYFAGGINGGIAEKYLELIRGLESNIRKDREQGIIAVWHDESHLNHYLLNKTPKILSPAFVYPEGWDLPFEPKILIRDKSRLGGHNFLRNVDGKIPLRKKIARFLKKFFAWSS